MTKPLPHLSQRQNPWTDERVEMAKGMWKKGNTATKIASHLGVSRNAVLGKMHRLGLSHRTSLSPLKEKQTLRRLALKIAKSAKSSAKRRIPPSIPGFAADVCTRTDTFGDVARIANVVDLEPHHCRWPIGEPGHAGFGFCGNQKLPGVSYCLTHARRATDAPRPKTRPIAKVLALVEA